MDQNRKPRPPAAAAEIIRAIAPRRARSRSMVTKRGNDEAGSACSSWGNGWVTVAEKALAAMVSRGMGWVEDTGGKASDATRSATRLVRAVSAIGRKCSGSRGED